MTASLILVGGPTASGKSAFALDLALRHNGTIINADALQVYSDAPLLTAQPDAAAKAACPHELYEVNTPDTPSSVAQWRDRAEQKIAEALNQGRTPILVGGSGMYFAALEKGLAEIPPVPAEIRAEANALYDRIGSEAFRTHLAQQDPASAAHIKPNDRQRLIRAYEVVTGTKHPLSFWQAETKPSALIQSLTLTRYLLLPPREVLYARCDQRFLDMMARGALAEVERFLAAYPDPSLPARKILGISSLAAYLDGQVSLEDALAKAQQLTRNYAKRQVTWFKNQAPASAIIIS